MKMNWRNFIASGMVATMMATSVAAQSNKDAEIGKTAEELFESALEGAKEGRAREQLAVAIRYETGDGVKQDSQKATAWLKQAVAQGHPQATARLAWHYMQGIGVLRNFPEADRLYREAYDLGVRGAAVNLAALYRKGGAGIDQNYAESVFWAKRAADAGNPRGQNILGELIRDGRGIRQSFQGALELFELAAAKRLPAAEYNASAVLRNGVGVKRDEKKAMVYLKRAAGAGHAAAMVDLGLAYAQGSGVAKNTKTSIQWFRKAARKSPASAMALARAHEQGVFGKPDLVRAYMWFTVAAKKGRVEGRIASAAVGRQLTKAQKDQANRLAKDWLNGKTS